MLSLLQDSHVPIIGVVGMGGSGKTFLLQKVYNATKSRVENSVWLSISKSYSVKNLQLDIAFQIGLIRENSEKSLWLSLSEETTAELIHERLQGKRSLIVLDDLWTEDDILCKLGLPADKDCKVVVTTRNKEVARNLKAHFYEMKNLSDEDSWKLFCIYAFPDCEENRAPSHLEEVGREIVKQCANLPLAIRTTAASLANTTRLSKWESKHRKFERAVIPLGEHDPVMDILKLSYDSLPVHLKPCFAYLSFFPEDEKIDCEYLVNLWIGEGFIPAGEEQWDIGWDWLDELAQLCLVQIWENPEYTLSYSKRLTKHCKIHDLLHDLTIHISRQNKCAFSVEEASTCTSAVSGWCRILLAKKDINDNALSHSHPAYLRTLSLSQNKDIRSIPENLFTVMRGLRVLDLSSTCISALPASIGKMILLKVLNLRDTRIYEVPPCVRNLKSLLFLAMPGRFLPEWISELKCLQHLECNYIYRMPNGIANMVSLRTLRSGMLALSMEEDLAKMTQLQEVRLIVRHDMQLKRMEEGILAQLKKMRHLEIQNAQFPVLAQFPEKMRAMKYLESLQLERFVVPSWICYMANLRELSLSNCEYGDFLEFQRMPNLLSLNLYGNHRCRELPKAFGKSGGFPHLRFLQISYFTKLEEFPQLEEGAMAFLEEFHLSRCFNLQKVGEGLELLKRL